MDFSKHGRLWGLVLSLLIGPMGCVTTQGPSMRNVDAPVVPGWVYVSYGLGAAEIAQRRGTLADTYDEYVGQLLDDGMSPERSGWLKPVYGNQNLLWVLDGETGKQRLHALQSTSTSFAAMDYTLRQGVLLIDDVKWWYAGSLLPSPEAAYQDFTFYCPADPGVSVMYWGDGAAAPAESSEAVHWLLRRLSPYCTTPQ